MSKKIKRKEGDFVRIRLDNDSACFARVLADPLIAFYDMRAVDSPTVEELESLPILFKIWVMNNAITSGRWPVIGHLPLDASLRQSVNFFKQDPISKKVYIYRDDQEYPASKEDCNGMECAAVWSAEHVEDRLRDHYAGVANKWVESLRIL